MNKKQNGKVGGGALAFAENKLTEVEHGRGRGLVSVGGALARARAGGRGGGGSGGPVVVAGAGDWARRPAHELVNAWYRGERDALGLIEAAAVEAAMAAQAAADVKMIAGAVARLVVKIEGCGREVSYTLRDEARGAGALAVTEWRNGARACPFEPPARVVEAGAASVEAWRARAVAWQAVRDEFNKSPLGRAVELSTVSDEFYADIGESWDIIEPLAAVACLSGWESRRDKAMRLRCERARERVSRQVRELGAARWCAKLPGALGRIMAGVKHARRRALVERIGRAAVLLIGGASIDDAARSVGFRDYKKGHAGDNMARAARRCGLMFYLTMPQGATAAAADLFKPMFRHRMTPRRLCSA